MSDDIYDYHFVSQGKITIPSMDDSEEMIATDVSKVSKGLKSRKKYKIARDPFECENGYTFIFTLP